MLNKLVEKIISNCVGDTVALVFKDRTITYNELLIESFAIAKQIYEKKINGSCVGIYLDRSEKVVISMIASWIAGCPYVPIDKNIGIERCREMIRQAEVSVLISDQDIDVNVPSIKYDECHSTDSYFDIIDQIMTYKYASMDDIAYVIFTSGSTGVPKGVKISYENILNLILSLNEQVYYGDIKKLNVSVLASFSFDSSVKQIFFALYYGHTLHIIDDKTKKIGRLLFKYLNNNHIDSLDITPTLLNLLDYKRKAESKCNISYVLIGGEKVQGEHINLARDMFGNDANIFNVYGPTECCVDTCIYKTPFNKIYDKAERIPVGYTVKDSSVELSLDGEIIIYGKCVGKGYTTENQGGFRNSKGKACYVTGDYGFFDDEGRLFVVGRKDSQTKLNGYRIDISDIEENIRRIEGVKLVKCFIYDNQIVSVISGIIKEYKYYKEKMQLCLPGYMIPTQIIFDDELKTNNNLKFDYRYYVDNYLASDNGGKKA